MPKRTRYPKLRAQSWRTAGGEVRTAYYYDMRGTGEPDVPLGTDYAQALLQHADAATTRRHYRGKVAALKTVR